MGFSALREAFGNFVWWQCRCVREGATGGVVEVRAVAGSEDDDG